MDAEIRERIDVNVSANANGGGSEGGGAGGSGRGGGGRGGMLAVSMSIDRE